MDDDEQRAEPDEDGATVLPAREAISIIVPDRAPAANGDSDEDERSKS
jgi:hypothetical protein